MLENANSKSSAFIKGTLSCGRMFTLIERGDIMRNIYITTPHISFMTYLQHANIRDP